jgi:uncharacterized protein YydD (DUF2326 family)
MKLSRLYTNQPALFSSINFHDGLNVILARVRHPKDPEKHSHCLGKSLLIDVIDFGLLCGVKSGHFLKTQAGRFPDLVFYLELHTHQGGYVTIRRSVARPTRIAFKRHIAPYQDFTTLADSAWDHENTPLEKAKLLLDSILELTAIKPWHYRKGVTYFLRSQRDYQDVFQLAKFGPGKHIDWKPYLAHILGMDARLLIQKYEADNALNDLSDRQKELQAEVTVRPADYEKLRASIIIKRDEVGSKTAALDCFDFRSQEAALVNEAAEKIESEIAENNTLLYNARHDITQLAEGLKDNIQFDLEDVKRVFEESSLTFPGQLARDYNDLVEFNRRILEERRSHLQHRITGIRSEVAQLEKESHILAARRREILEILGGTDSLQKYKDLQRQLDTDRANLALMEERAAKLGAVIALNEDLRKAKVRREQLAGKIENMLLAAGAQHARSQTIAVHFSRIIKEVLHRTAILYVKQNGEGNLDFCAEFTDSNSDAPTEEHKGNTFKQVLCIAFDLAVLVAYADAPFFHFVYHDGGLEQKQNKVKLALLQVVRTTCREHHIQYILSALEEDLRIPEDTDSLCPAPREIILELDDGGNDGRLFKMPRF